MTSSTHSALCALAPVAPVVLRAGFARHGVEITLTTDMIMMKTDVFEILVQVDLMNALLGFDSDSDFDSDFDSDSDSDFDSDSGFDRCAHPHHLSAR